MRVPTKALVCVLAGVLSAVAAPPIGPAKVTLKVMEVGRVAIAPASQPGKDGKPVAVPFGFRAGTTEDKLLVDEFSARTGPPRLMVQGKVPGTYLIVLWSANETESSVIEVEVTGTAPAPPPGPDGKPDPKPTPGKVARLRTVVVSESADLDARKSKFLGDKALGELYAARKWDGPWWIDPQHKDPDTGAMPAKWKVYADQAAKLKLKAALFLTDADTGDVLYEGEPPATPADLLKLLKAKAGE